MRWFRAKRTAAAIMADRDKQSRSGNAASPIWHRTLLADLSFPGGRATGRLVIRAEPRDDQGWPLVSGSLSSAFSPVLPLLPGGGARYRGALDRAQALEGGSG
jgi:hypothetical protein